MKKRLALLAMIGVMVLSFGACGGGSSTPQDNGTSVKTEQETDTSKKDDAKEDDFSKVEKEYKLSSGHYTAGIDIPAGSCDLKAKSGTGNISSSNIFDGGVNEMFGKDDGTGLYTESFKGLKLSEGDVLSVSGSVVVKVTYKEVTSNISKRKSDKKNTLELSSGNYTVGSDIKEGVYTIKVSSGSGNISSSNMFDGGLNEVMGTDDKDDMYIQSCKNVSLSDEDTLSISGNLKVKLIPQK